MGQWFSIFISIISQVQVVAYSISNCDVSIFGWKPLFFYFRASIFYSFVNCSWFSLISDVIIIWMRMVELIVWNGIHFEMSKMPLIFPLKFSSISSTASRQMLSHSPFCSSSSNSSSVNSNSRWFHYKTVTCRVELRLYTMWSQQFMSWATSLHN